MLRLRALTKTKSRGRNEARWGLRVARVMAFQKRTICLSTCLGRGTREVRVLEECLASIYDFQCLPQVFTCPPCCLRWRHGDGNAKLRPFSRVIVGQEVLGEKECEVPQKVGSIKYSVGGVINTRYKGRG